MPNHAHKGRRREHQSRALLEAEGYVVTRAAGSKGAFDLIALRADGVLLIQCKSNRGPSPAERAAMMAVEVPENCRRIVHTWIDGEGEPRVTEL